MSRDAQMGNTGREDWASTEEDGTFSGKRKMFAFSIFQIWLPLGCVFDVNVAEPSVRFQNFISENRHRILGSLTAGLPDREEIHNRPE